jgi:GWxTD domain-containing protein
MMLLNMIFMVILFKKVKQVKLYVVFLFCFSALNGQVETRQGSASIDLPEFFIDAISFSSGDSLSSRVDIYLQVPYDALQFVKKDKEYVSKYDITVNFIAEDKSSTSEKMWADEVHVSNFDETESKKAYNMSQRSIMITPGIYTLRAQLRDNESKKLSTVVKKIVVGNYTMKNLALSDLMLVSKVTTEGEQKSIVPNVSGNIGFNNNTFFVFFEIYSPQVSDSITLHYVITDYNGKEFLNKSQNYGMRGFRSQVITRFDSSQYSTGTYTITVEAHSLLHDTEPIPVLKRKIFSVRLGNMSLNISDLDLAIRQLRYIAKDKEYDQMADADSETEKRRLFDEFWKKRDPNPDTKRNEFMEEYYSRVDYANEHFSHYVPGWRTDMGMVFILFGSPNNVERHPFDINSKPYEIWSYYDYNRNVTFVDETGFGDYCLLTPIYDMLQRLKY